MKLYLLISKTNKVKISLIEPDYQQITIKRTHRE